MPSSSRFHCRKGEIYHSYWLWFLCRWFAFFLWYFNIFSWCFAVCLQRDCEFTYPVWYKLPVSVHFLVLKNSVLISKNFGFLLFFFFPSGASIFIILISSLLTSFIFSISFVSVLLAKELFHIWLPSYSLHLHLLN